MDLSLTGTAYLASILLKQGRYNEAEELFIQIAEIRTRVLGLEHPDTLTSINNLAATYLDWERKTWKQKRYIYS